MNYQMMPREIQRNSHITTWSDRSGQQPVLLLREWLYDWNRWPDHTQGAYVNRNYWNSSRSLEKIFDRRIRIQVVLLNDGDPDPTPDGMFIKRSIHYNNTIMKITDLKGRIRKIPNRWTHHNPKPENGWFRNRNWTVEERWDRNRDTHNPETVDRQKSILEKVLWLDCFKSWSFLVKYNCRKWDHPPSWIGSCTRKAQTENDFWQVVTTNLKHITMKNRDAMEGPGV